MDLREALQILKENNYTCSLNEGVLGKAITIGALTTGLAAGKEKIDCPELNFSDKATLELFGGDTQTDTVSLEDYNCYKLENGDYSFELKAPSFKKMGTDLKQYVVITNSKGKLQGTAWVYGDKDARLTQNDSNETENYIERHYEKNKKEEKIWYDEDEDETYIVNIDKNGNGTLQKVLGNAVFDIDINNDFDGHPTTFEATYKNGKLNGKYYSYYSSGELEEEGTYKNGKVDGIVKNYFTSGRLALTYKMVNGKRVGMTQCTDGRRGNANITCYDKEE